MAYGPELVTSLTSKTGRGTVEVFREYNGRLTCSCGQPNSDHMVTATIAQSAGVQVVDPETRCEVLASFESQSSSKIYSVKRDRHTGDVSCNCRGWILAMKKTGKPCWHVEEAVGRPLNRRRA